MSQRKNTRAMAKLALGLTPASDFMIKGVLDNNNGISDPESNVDSDNDQNGPSSKPVIKKKTTTTKAAEFKKKLEEEEREKKGLQAAFKRSNVKATKALKEARAKEADLERAFHRDNGMETVKIINAAAVMTTENKENKENLEESTMNDPPLPTDGGKKADGLNTHLDTQPDVSVDAQPEGPRHSEKGDGENDMEEDEESNKKDPADKTTATEDTTPPKRGFQFSPSGRLTTVIESSWADSTPPGERPSTDPAKDKKRRMSDTMFPKDITREAAIEAAAAAINRKTDSQLDDMEFRVMEVMRSAVQAVVGADVIWCMDELNLLRSLHKRKLIQVLEDITTDFIHEYRNNMSKPPPPCFLPFAPRAVDMQSGELSSEEEDGDTPSLKSDKKKKSAGKKKGKKDSSSEEEMSGSEEELSSDDELSKAGSEPGDTDGNEDEEEDSDWNDSSQKENDNNNSSDSDGDDDDSDAASASAKSSSSLELDSDDEDKKSKKKKKKSAMKKKPKPKNDSDMDTESNMGNENSANKEDGWSTAANKWTTSSFSWTAGPTKWGKLPPLLPEITRKMKSAEGNNPDSAKALARAGKAVGTLKPLNKQAEDRLDEFIKSLRSAGKKADFHIRRFQAEPSHYTFTFRDVNGARLYKAWIKKNSPKGCEYKASLLCERALTREKAAAAAAKIKKAGKDNKLKAIVAAAVAEATAKLNKPDSKQGAKVNKKSGKQAPTGYARVKLIFKNTPTKEDETLIKLFKKQNKLKGNLKDADLYFENKSSRAVCAFADGECARGILKIAAEGEAAQKKKKKGKPKSRAFYRCGKEKIPLNYNPETMKAIVYAWKAKGAAKKQK